MEDDPRSRGAGAAVRWAGFLLLLRTLLGGAANLEIGGRRFRLSRESVFRLEEVDGSFVYFLRNAGAVERRLAELSRRHPGPWCDPGDWSEDLPRN